MRKVRINDKLSQMEGTQKHGDPALGSRLSLVHVTEAHGDLYLEGIG